jgi:hypothetical protein
MTRIADVANTGQDGEFSLAVRGAGEYFVVVLPPSVRDRANDPAVLDELSRSASIVRVEEGAQVFVKLPALPNR